MEPVREYSCVKMTRQGAEPATDPVMVEQTIELIINGTKLSSIVTTPDNHIELAIGYMITEGAVQSREDIEDYREENGRVYLKIRSFEHFDLWYELRSSGCIGVNWERRDDNVSLPVRQKFKIDVILDSLKYLFSETQERTRRPQRMPGGRGRHTEIQSAGHREAQRHRQSRWHGDACRR
jgi:FdhD protein